MREVVQIDPQLDKRHEWENIPKNIFCYLN